MNFNFSSKPAKTCAPGAHKVAWDARDDSGARVASGLYLYTIRVGRNSPRRRSSY